MTTATAPGKIILLGEHAVVYRRPALAVPLDNLTAQATIEERSEAGMLIEAPDLGREFRLNEADVDDPLAKVIRLTLAGLNQSPEPALLLRVQSELPIAAGLGSGAAVSVAIIRALSAHFGYSMPPAKQAEIAFEIEKLHHGTPSGIDNTVIAHEAPVYFLQGAPLETFQLAQPIQLLIGDTGVESSTARAVGGVRTRWQQSKSTYEGYFDEIGQLANRARQALAVGNLDLLGRLMNANQTLLEKIGVSSPELDRLINAARQSGALGAKLSGGGLGGNMIALTMPEDIERIRSTLKEHGAKRIWHAEVEA